MKIRLSELRKIIREEISSIVNEGPEDDQAYEKIMAMITSALGDSPETKKMGSELHGAFQAKRTETTPGTLSMKSIAQPTRPQAQSANDITMTSVAKPQRR